MTSRRIFLRDGGLALVSLGFAPSFLARTAAAAATRQKLLIAIFQRGASGRPQHGRSLRRTRVLQEPARQLPSPGPVAPMPRSISMASLRSIRGWRRSSRSTTAASWRSFTRAVRPIHTRSHFDAQDYMESGTPGVKSTDDGWLNRTLSASRVPDVVALSRRGAGADAATCAAGRRLGAGNRADRAVRTPRRRDGDGRRRRRSRSSTRRLPIRSCRRRAARRLTPSG